jgi:hypothetical protein
MSAVGFIAGRYGKTAGNNVKMNGKYSQASTTAKIVNIINKNIGQE